MQGDQNDKKSVNTRIMKFEMDDLNRFPHAAQALAILIPAVQKCYNLWNPIEAGMDEQTFRIHLLRSTASAAQIYYNQQKQETVDLSAVAEMDVPHIEEVVLILASAYDQCRAIWPKEDYDRNTFTSMAMGLMNHIASTMYESKH